MASIPLMLRVFGKPLCGIIAGNTVYNWDKIGIFVVYKGFGGFELRGVEKNYNKFLEAFLAMIGNHNTDIINNLQCKDKDEFQTVRSYFNDDHLNYVDKVILYDSINKEEHALEI
jgi:hypothetical protein